MEMPILSDPSQRELRHEIPGGRHVIVTLQTDDHRADDVTFDAQLLDLSERGAKLSLPQDVPINQQLRMRLNVEDLGLDFYVAGDVCWSKPGHNGDWQLGCSVQPKLPARIIEHIAIGNRADRRDEDRSAGTIQGCVLVTATQQQHVALQNYSEGGACLLTKDVVKIGDLVSLMIPNHQGEPLHARVQWGLHVANGYLMGCSWHTTTEFHRLASMTNEPISAAPEPLAHLPAAEATPAAEPPLICESSPAVVPPPEPPVYAPPSPQQVAPVQAMAPTQPPLAETAPDWKSFFRTKVKKN